MGYVGAGGGEEGFGGLEGYEELSLSFAVWFLGCLFCEFFF